MTRTVTCTLRSNSAHLLLFLLLFTSLSAIIITRRKFLREPLTLDIAAQCSWNIMASSYASSVRRVFTSRHSKVREARFSRKPKRLCNVVLAIFSVCRTRGVFIDWQAKESFLTRRWRNRCIQLSLECFQADRVVDTPSEWRGWMCLSECREQRGQVAEICVS